MSINGWFINEKDQIFLIDTLKVISLKELWSWFQVICYYEGRVFFILKLPTVHDFIFLWEISFFKVTEWDFQVICQLSDLYSNIFQLTNIQNLSVREQFIRRLSVGLSHISKSHRQECLTSTDESLKENEIMSIKLEKTFHYTID
jgi:elongation factor P--beta-lysine ligase